MIVGFLPNDLPRERLLADALAAGARAHGDQSWVLPKALLVNGEPLPDADVYGLAGVKSRELVARIHARGAHWLYFDKGYTRQLTRGDGPRGWEFWRVAIDAHQPTRYLDRLRPPDRWLAWEMEMRSWRRTGEAVVICGSSEKYHAFVGLPHPTKYAGSIVKRLRKQGLTDRPIIYRPKPTWRAAEPIPGTIYSGPGQALADVLAVAHCMITHGSNAGVDAVLAGVPVIVLGDSTPRPISSTMLEDVEEPFLARKGARVAWASSLAYWQWTRHEIASGEAWGELRGLIL